MLNDSQIKEMINKAITLIELNYVIEEKKDKIIDGLRKNLENGDYYRISDDDLLTKKITDDLFKLSDDKHLYIRTLSKRGNEKKLSYEEWLKQEREEEIRGNFGFSEVKIIEENIGYLRIKKFMNPDRGIHTAISAMQFIENTNATVIDLRDNGGGYGGLAEFIISYFFNDEPKLLSTTKFKEEDMRIMQAYTHPFVVGKRRLNHKLFIIINEKTGSAAEYFAYVLQANKKAIIVGEKSSGAANRNTFYPLNDTLRISISTGTPIIEATSENWEGVGVIPDIPCDPNNALEKIMSELDENN
ncbi:S41 family peptidase [Alteribacter populi]|uniref:S41 family peptidase n=1 Tax=Alteribacter populi TaxID=2011011 RepID=UPI000BBB53AF|nr:S41 family peptidase [Alteribacter populi]